MHDVRTPADPQPPLVWLDEVDSTNTYARRLFDTLPHGAAVVAERQQAGMGRGGRRWHSPPGGNVYMTVVARPPVVHERNVGGITLSMALAVCDVLDAWGVAGAVKWPNDVRVGRQKIAGILAQAVHTRHSLAGVVVGVGINANMGRHELERIDQPATSLSVLTGRPVDASRIARSVAARFLQRLATYDPVFVRAEALRRADYLGQAVTVSTPQGEVTGQAVDLDDSFRLVIEDGRGVRHVVQAGDIRC